jgi:hypothetical protein
LRNDLTKERKTLLKWLKDEGMMGVADIERTPRMMFLLKGEGNVTPHFKPLNICN